MTGRSGEATKQSTVRLPLELHKRLKVWLIGQGKTFTDWAREHAEEDTKEEGR